MISPTDSEHARPIFPNLVRDIVPKGPDQLWVANLTHVAVMGEFVNILIILDASPQRVVGYALGQSTDACLTLAALRGN